MDKILEKLLNAVRIIASFFITWRRIIITLVLGLFAFYVTFKFLIALINQEIEFIRIYEVGGFGLFIFVLSFIVFKFLPFRFTNWDLGELKRRFKKEKNGQIRLLLVLFASPLTNFFMSVALSIYIFSFISQEINNLWNVVILNSEYIYKFLASYNYMLLGGLFLFPILFFLPIIFIAKMNEYLKNIMELNPVIKYFFYIASIIGLAVYILIVLDIDLSIFSLFNLTDFYHWRPSSFELLKNISGFLQNLLVYFIKFVVGFIPLGWFYELFIGSIWKEDKVNMALINKKL